MIDQRLLFLIWYQLITTAHTISVELCRITRQLWSKRFHYQSFACIVRSFCLKPDDLPYTAFAIHDFCHTGDLPNRWFAKHDTYEICHTRDLPCTTFTTHHIFHAQGLPHRRFSTHEVCHSRDLPYTRFAIHRICNTRDLLHRRFTKHRICHPYHLPYTRFVIHHIPIHTSSYINLLTC